MMCISLKFHEQNSIYWGSPSIHYPARGQAPEIYASLVKNIQADWRQLILLTITLVLSILGAVMIARGITKPIKLLITQVKSVAKGSYICYFFGR